MRSSLLTVFALLSSSLACSGGQPAPDSAADLTVAPPPTAAPTTAAPAKGEPAPEALATPAAPLPDGDPALARKLVREGAVLLDVRTPQEWDERHLEGAALIPVQDLDARLPEVEKLTAGDRAKPIVVYCKSGKRAGQAKDKLARAGYTQVTNLGGIDDWTKDCPGGKPC